MGLAEKLNGIDVTDEGGIINEPDVLNGLGTAPDAYQPPLWVNPIEGIITSPGGLRYNPVTGRREFHDGIDIAAPIGTPIVAPRDGTVLATGNSPSFGVYLRMAHPNGYVSFMAHLYGVTVSVGETVRQGERVAYSGNTGRSTGPHLHYSLFRYGQFVDPIDYVDLPESANLIAPLSW